MKLSLRSLLPLALALAPSVLAQETETPQGAKNIILMISDGIGYNGWLASDYYQRGEAGAQAYQQARPDGTEPVHVGQAHWALNFIDEAGNVSDEENSVGVLEQYYDPATRWEALENAFRNDFPPVEASYTSYTDSSSAATALYTGRKTTNGRINQSWDGETNFATIAEIADAMGKATGAVSSVMASHATPGAVWSHNASRNNYAEIFNEMVASGLDVIMGGGHPDYDSSGNEVSEERDYQYVGGEETWQQLISDEGLNGFTFIESREDFEALASGDMDAPEKLVGIPRTISTLQASREELGESAENPSGMAFNEDVPDLATMTQGALNVLSQNEAGFFLMSEGGAVDWMGHANDMGRFIEEQMDFDRAVEVVIEWVEANSSWEETLLIVTSDHETGGIWGEGTYESSQSDETSPDLADEEAVAAARFDPNEDTFNEFLAVQNNGAGEMPGYQFASGNHTNELVPLWAFGPGSELFAQFVRTDQGAAELWGEPYGWDGSFVDNTDVFTVMYGAFSGALMSAPETATAE